MGGHAGSITRIVVQQPLRIRLGPSFQEIVFTSPRHQAVGLFDDVCFAGRRPLDGPNRIGPDGVDQSLE